MPSVLLCDLKYVNITILGTKTKGVKMSQSKNEPVPTGPMYIGICATRAQAIAQRWQGVIVFIASNSALANILVGIFYIGTASQMLKMLVILILATIFNYVWFKLIERANKWIEFYTIQLREMEEKSGTESGITIFSNEKYPSSNLNRGDVRSSSGIKYMIMAVLYACYACDVSAIAYILYQLGRSNW